MTKHKVVMEASEDGSELFIFYDGLKIAQRGKPGTAQAGKWIAVEPGYEVVDLGKSAIEVKYNGAVVH